MRGHACKGELLTREDSGPCRTEITVASRNVKIIAQNIFQILPFTNFREKIPFESSGLSKFGETWAKSSSAIVVDSPEPVYTPTLNCHDYIFSGEPAKTTEELLAAAHRRIEEWEAAVEKQTIYSN